MNVRGMGDGGWGWGVYVSYLDVHTEVLSLQVGNVPGSRVCLEHQQLQKEGAGRLLLRNKDRGPACSAELVRSNGHTFPLFHGRSSQFPFSFS